ncbi:MAG: pilus assembly protein TadG-related protein [Pseudomonadota bacterium]
MPHMTLIQKLIFRAGLHLTRKLTSFRRNTYGGVAAIVAITSPVLIGAMGLGGEAGYWYLTQRKVQNAADVAAHAAALRSNAGDTGAALQGIAEYVVDQADLDLTVTNVALNQPPITGGFIEDGTAVEVVVTQTVPRMFSAMYSSDPLEITARAVATAQSGGRGCMVALSDTEEGAITVGGASFINLLMCDFISNSGGVAFDMVGAGSFVTANCVQTTGTADVTANLATICTSLRENASPAQDPFAGVAEPALTGACQDGNVGLLGQATTLSPIEAHSSGMTSMRFCNGLTLNGNVTLDPGLYLVEGGDLQVSTIASITGNGVMIFLADGVEMNIDATATVNLVSPRTGTYNGMLIFGSRSATSASHQVNGNFGSILDGAIYTPESQLVLQGNAGTAFDGCTQIIADTIDMTGSMFMTIHCMFPPGPVADISGAVAVVE